MSNLTLFSQIISKLDRIKFAKLVKERQTDKHQKGYTSWSQLVAMLFCQFATSQITFVSNKESENLKISIRDLTNRIILNQNLKINGFIANLDLELINGVYLITVSNVNNEQITKKLLIAK